jgi:hypothetical protein
VKQPLFECTAIGAEHELCRESACGCERVLVDEEHVLLSIEPRCFAHGVLDELRRPIDAHRAPTHLAQTVELPDSLSRCGPGDWRTCSSKAE